MVKLLEIDDDNDHANDQTTTKHQTTTKYQTTTKDHVIDPAHVGVEEIKATPKNAAGSSRATEGHAKDVIHPWADAGVEESKEPQGATPEVATRWGTQGSQESQEATPDIATR